MRLSCLRQFPLPIPTSHSLHSVHCLQDLALFEDQLPLPLPSFPFSFPFIFKQMQHILRAVDPEPPGDYPLRSQSPILSHQPSFLMSIDIYCQSVYCIYLGRHKHRLTAWNSLPFGLHRYKDFFAPFPPPWWLLPKLFPPPLLCPHLPILHGAISILLTGQKFCNKNSKVSTTSTTSTLSSDYLTEDEGQQTGKPKANWVSWLPETTGNYSVTWKLRCPVISSWFPPFHLLLVSPPENSTTC